MSFSGGVSDNTNKRAVSAPYFLMIKFGSTVFLFDLLKCLQNLKNWPEKVKTMQESWIGKSKGITIEFEIIGLNKKLKIFTIHPHTLFGASFCAVAAEHPIIKNFKNKKIQDFVDNLKIKGKMTKKLEFTPD